MEVLQAVSPENYRVIPQGAVDPIAAFSVNVSPDESQLDKVPAETIEDLLGKDSILIPEQKVSLPDALQSHLRQPLELFPWLMILLLLMLAVENLLANRFYRQPVANDPEQ